jgi:quercetin dioxygenase-like cupin family protein
MANSDQISRKRLCKLVFDQQISNIEMQEITMGAGKSAPKHIHPCPVIGIIKSGKILFQIEHQDKIILNEGDSFYEPKGLNILHFDNASATDPVTFVAIYLKEGNEENIQFIG